MHPTLTRREALGVAAAGLAGVAADAPGYRLATFSADITPPVGHPCMGGGISPVKGVDDPLSAQGLVLLGAGRPVVLAALDWCEVRNDAYSRWREALAEAAGTEPARVVLASVHQHDAPVADLEAQRLLERHKAAGAVCDLAFHERAVRGVARAVRAALAAPRRVTHVGTGQARVEKVASNRRYPGPDSRPRFGRTSATRDPQARAAPEGLVDPWLKAVSFWDGDRPLAVLSFYATHPMSHYGRGRVSSDFVGLARRRRQADDPGVFQVYFSGCSGNVTAGKYNDGAPANRAVLTERMVRGMAAAWKATRRQPLGAVGYRTVPLRLEPRGGPGYTVADLTSRLKGDARPFGQCLAALGLSWRQRTDAGHVLDVPVLDLGPAQVLLLPAEAYVEYQLKAQALRPDSFVAVAGYGECAPGYIPTEQAFREGDTNLHDWCWVAPGCERAMTRALEAALRASP